MSFADDFFKSSSTLKIDKEEAIGLILENYFSIMKVYRVIQTQTTETKKKKLNAQKELNKLRKIENSINPKSLSPMERKELKFKKEYYTKIREEEDVIYFEGKALTDKDLYIILIKRYKYLFALLESGDRKVREKIAKILKTQVDDRIKKLRNKNKNSKSLKAVSKISFKDLFIKTFLTNLIDHQPTKKQEKDDYSIMITYK
jgi:hypothetical protein